MVPGAARPHGVAENMRDSRWGRLWAAQEGRSAILYALLAAAAVIAGIAIRDWGGAFLDQKTLGSAALAGAVWGRNHGYDENGIAAAVRAATELRSVSVTPSSLCGCPGKSGIIETECNSRCPEGGGTQLYIVVTASFCYGTSLPWPGVRYCSSADSQCVDAGCNGKQVVLSGQAIVLR